MSGDCFRKAYEVACRERGDDLDSPDLLIVHGRPVGRGVANRGRRFWHAWVEQRTEVGWRYLDESNGATLNLPRDTAYALGSLTEEHVHRYTLNEACEHLFDADQTWGPWVPGWEGMAL